MKSRPASTPPPAGRASRPGTPRPEPEQAGGAGARTPPVESWGVEAGPEQLRAVQTFSRSGDALLDLGAGRGAITVALRSRGYRAVGVDRQAWPEWRGHPPEWFRVADAARLPFRDASFDATLAFEVLEHCPDPDAVLAEIARCTRSHLILSVPDCDLDTPLRHHNLVPAHWTDPTHCNFFVKQSLVAAVERAGMRVVEVGGCTPIRPNTYFWKTLRIPRRISKLGRRICERLDLAPSYWSSILLVAEVPREAQPTSTPPGP